MLKSVDSEHLCECGCGHYTKIAARTVAKRGIHKGEPLRFMNGHNSRLPRRHGHGGQGQKRSSTYNIWASMKRRCLNPRQQTWAAYGGRGIRVCQRWLDFPAFLEDMGERPEGLSIDRMNGEGHYSCGRCAECQENDWPMNCRWSMWSEQMLNRAPYTHKKRRIVRGEAHNLSDLSKQET